MKRHQLVRRLFSALFLLAVAIRAIAVTGSGGDSQPAKPFGIAKRVPWTTSHIKGSPEPPLPFRAEMAFPHLAFDFPLDLVMGPGSNRWFVAEQFGRIYSFPNDPKCKKA